MLTDAELQQMLADAERMQVLRKYVTPAPWTARFIQQDAIIEDADGPDGEVARMQLPFGAVCVDVMNNFDFIASSRTDPSAANVLRLVEEVRRLNAKEITPHPAKTFYFKDAIRFSQYAKRFPMVARDAAEEIIDACHIHGVPVPEHLKPYEKEGE